MGLLIAGLILFLGVHSTRIFADDWRAERIGRMGEKPWKAVYSLASIAGFALIVWGYHGARHDPTVLWTSPYAMHHVTAFLMLPAFILVVAAYVPGTRIKAAVGHPMLAGTMIWSFGHLLSNGQLADVLLFGAFLAWSTVDLVASRRRDRKSGTTYPARGVSRDLIAVAIGAIAWAVFGMFLHGPVIGVRPFA